MVVELVAALWKTDPRPPPSWTTCLSGVMPRPLDMVGAGVPSLELSLTTEGRGMGATGTGAGTEPEEKYQYTETYIHSQINTILTWHPHILLAGGGWSASGATSSSSNARWWLVLHLEDVDGIT